MFKGNVFHIYVDTIWSSSFHLQTDFFTKFAICGVGNLLLLYLLTNGAITLILQSMCRQRHCKIEVNLRKDMITGVVDTGVKLDASINNTGVRWSTYRRCCWYRCCWSWTAISVVYSCMVQRQKKCEALLWSYTGRFRQLRFYICQLCFPSFIKQRTRKLWITIKQF
jgi:hypothetical protein